MAIIRLQGEEEKRQGIHYEIDSSIAPIGVGGMGQVFKGICIDEQTSATRPVAIKFMYDDLPPQAVERARREASVRLRNDNLVEMLGFIEIGETSGQGETKMHYHVVSELLDGVSLSDILEGKTKGRDGDDIPYAVKLLQDYRNDSEHFARVVVKGILSGLMALHDAGYVHRDIDPSNIMVTRDGKIKLIDFGIAKQMNTLTTSDKALTVAGKFMGKPEYAAPELAIGDIAHQDQTTDIYAMGILLYQCIVGHTPFEGARHEILEKQMREKLPLGAIKNRHLRSIIETACQKKQSLRYQSTAQMRVALDMKSAPSSSKTKYFLIGGGALLLVAAIVAGVMMFSGSNEESKPTENKAETNVVAQKVMDEALANEREADALKEKTAATKPETEQATVVETKTKTNTKTTTETKTAAGATSEKANAPSYLSVSPQKLKFKVTAKTTETVVVSSSGDWAVASSPSWCNVSKSGNALTVKANVNESGEKREGKITIRCGNVTKTITVQQNGKKTIF